MSPIKLRRILVSIHLYAAALLAPAFLLVATTGGLYLAGVEGEMVETPVAVPAGTSFDPKSPTFEADVKAFLVAQNLPADFDYIRAKGPNFTTRPTSRTHVAFESKDGVVTAKKVSPTPMAAWLEIHKGHGPQLYRIYGVLVGLMLFIVVFGGLAVGYLSPAYRKATVLSTAAGSLVFAYVAFFA